MTSLETTTGETRIYAVGGLQNNTQECAVIEVFELNTNQWTTLSHIPLSTLPIIADGFVGSCVVFPCRQNSVFELLAIDSGEDFEDAEELNDEINELVESFGVKESSGVEVAVEAVGEVSEEEEEDDGLF